VSTTPGIRRWSSGHDAAAEIGLAGQLQRGQPGGTASLGQVEDEGEVTLDAVDGVRPSDVTVAGHDRLGAEA
jgi:hypothetical protein